MRNVRKRAAMNQNRGIFQRLDEVGFDCVFHQSSHCAVRFQVTGIDRAVVISPGDQDIAHPFFQVHQVLCQAEDCHDLGSNSDDKAILTGNAVCLAAHADDNMPQGTVIHIHAAFEQDTPGVDSQLVALLDMVVDHCAEQVIGSGNRVHIAGKMQVDVLHRDNLRISAAGGTTLNAEDRAKRRFTQCQYSLFANACHCLTQTNRRSRLALTGRGRIDRGDQHQPSIRVAGDLTRQFVRKFCFIFSIKLKVIRVNADTGGHLRNGKHMRLLSNFDICKHILHPFLFRRHRKQPYTANIYSL